VNKSGDFFKKKLILKKLEKKVVNIKNRRIFVVQLTIMKPIDVIRKIATSQTVQTVIVNDSKPMSAMSAISLLTFLNRDMEMSASFKVNHYKMGGTWEDITRLIVTSI
jgi:hypothetical protein